jgi:Ni/Co efflux regulator RcnB
VAKLTIMNNNRYITILFTKGGSTMRALAALIIATIFLASCSKTYESATTYPYDEVYDTYGESRVAYTNSNSLSNSGSQRDSESYSEGDYYSPEYTTDEFESEDYYDYEYASRVRRFHQPNPGFGYYDPFYTDYYRYGYSPFSFGTSIYSGWGSMYPHYAMPRYRFSLSFGYGYNPYYSPWYNPWYYDAWYNPWYGYYPPTFGYGPYYNYGSYWNGYYHGFYDGYYANTYYPTSGYYYGPRGTVGGSSDGSGRGSRNLTGPAGGSSKSDQTAAGNGTLVSSKRIEDGGGKKISSSSATKALKPRTSSKVAGGAIAGGKADKMQKPASERSVSAPNQASKTTILNPF